MNLYGKPKSRKTRLVMGMAEAVANQKPTWLSFEVCKHGPVAVLQLDTPPGELSARLEAMERTGHSTEHIYVSDMVTSHYPFNILNPVHQGWLKQELAKIQPVLVIVDTFRESFDGDENSSEIQKAVVSKLVEACLPAALIILSHARKDSLFAKDDDDLMGENRGSGYLAGRMDCVIRMTPRMMSYQGRAVGRKNVPIDPLDTESGLLHLGAVGEDDQHKELVIDAAKAILKKDPTIGKNALAKQLVDMFKISESTAKRRLDDAAPGHWTRPAKGEPPVELKLAA